MNTLAPLYIVLAMLIVMNLGLLQSLSTAQNAGNTLVLGLPGFKPLKNG